MVKFDNLGFSIEKVKTVDFSETIAASDLKVSRSRHLIEYTPQPLYNTFRYNTVLDITQISVGPQMVIFDLFSFITIHFTLVITRFG